MLAVTGSGIGETIRGTSSMRGSLSRKRSLCRRLALSVLMFVAALCATQAFAEDGYDLWLRYRPLASEQAQTYRNQASQLIVGTATPTQAATRESRHFRVGYQSSEPQTNSRMTGRP